MGTNVFLAFGSRKNLICAKVCVPMKLCTLWTRKTHLSSRDDVAAAPQDRTEETSNRKSEPSSNGEAGGTQSAVEGSQISYG